MILEIIHTDELTHVTAGHGWFGWVCRREGVDPRRSGRKYGADRGAILRDPSTGKTGLGLAYQGFCANLEGEMGYVSKVAVRQRTNPSAV